MSLSLAQIKLIQAARRQAGVHEDAPWRMILRSAGKVQSCKDLDNAGFEAVMAVLEDMGFRDRVHPGDHWRTKAARQPTKANERMVHKIIMLAQSCRYSLPTLCLRATDQRTQFPENLTPKEAWDMIEMLKAVNARELKRNDAGDYVRPEIPDLFPSQPRRPASAVAEAPLPRVRPTPAAVPCEIKEDLDDIPF